MTPGARRGVGLTRVLEDLGTTVLELVRPPADPDDRISGLVIPDPGGDELVPERAIVLGVGVYGTEATSALLELAGASGALAVVVRTPVDLQGRALAAAVRTGVAVVSLARGAAWTQVTALLRAVLADGDVGGESGDDMIGGIPSGDLFALAHAVSALIDAPVTIEDRSSRVLAFSGRQDEGDEGRVETVLGRQVPQAYRTALEEIGLFQELSRSTGPVFIDQRRLDHPKVQISRTAVAVRAGDEMLGSMWAVTRNRLSRERQQAFTDSARLVALHLLRQRAGADGGRRLRADLLATVLRGGAGAVDAADRLGLTQGFSVVMAVVPAGESEFGPTVDLEAVRDRLADAFAVHLSAIHARAATALVGGIAYGVLPLDGPSDRREETAVRIAREFVERTQHRLPAIVGVGRVTAGIGQLSLSRVDADRAVRVLRSQHAEAGVATIADAHIDALMLDLADHAAAQGYEQFGALSSLQEYDRLHAADLARTVQVWLETFGDASEAAGRLAVHPNTLRYRLRRAAEVSGIDLGDPRDRFALMIQLRLTPLT